MKHSKKIFICLMATALVSFAFAQEKTLSDYLDEINTLIQADISRDTQFKLAFNEAVTELQTSAQEKIAEISRQEKLPWESPDEYTERLNNDISVVQDKLQTEIGNKTKELRNAYTSDKTEISNKKTRLWIEIGQKKFKYTGDSVEVIFGDFDVYGKYWPVVVRSLDNHLNYNSGTLKYAPSMDVIKSKYFEIQKLIDARQIAGEINVMIKQKNQMSDTYEIHLIDVILYGPRKEVLCRFDGKNEIIQTIDYLKDVYEPSTVIPADAAK